jgi:ankyrin repeat protein
MSDPTKESASGAIQLPDNPNLDWLRKAAKRRLEEMRVGNPDAHLADAQFDLARQYGFPSWRALKAHIDSLTLEGQLFAAAKNDANKLAALLDAHPDKLLVRDEPYEHSLLHAAAQSGNLAAVDLLLKRGIDVNIREKGDNTYPMHWAAAAGHVEVVRRLVEAGGDVVGHGDDHELEVIGWATCWNGTDTDAHRAVVDVLVRHGARQHIFSAIAMNLGDEVRRIVAADPSALNRRMSRNEANQLPLHFAVRMNRPQMAALLIELGADPLGVDGMGQPVAVYASTPDSDRPVMQAIRALTSAELLSADRGKRATRAAPMDLVAALALGDDDAASRLVRDNPELLTSGGALHIMARRNDIAAVKWLLERGADPNARWGFGDSEMTAMHLAAWEGHADMVRLLLDAGGDPKIHDKEHDSDVLGWAEYAGKLEVVEILRARA